MAEIALDWALAQMETWVLASRTSERREAEGKRGNLHAVLTHRSLHNVKFRHGRPSNAPKVN